MPEAVLAWPGFEWLEGGIVWRPMSVDRVVRPAWFVFGAARTRA